MFPHAVETTANDARLWIYGADRPLTTEERRMLEQHMDEFLTAWRSHGRKIAPSWSLVHDQFLVIAVDEAAMQLSGCSIDSMFHAVELFGRRVRVEFSRGGNQVFYRDTDGRIQRVDRLDFSDLARRGEVDAETPVFDNTISTVGEYRSGGWEVPLRASWHMKAFGKALSEGGGTREGA